MKRIILGSVFLTLMIALAIYTSQPTDVEAWTGWWGGKEVPVLKAVADTTSLTTFTDVVDAHGPGIIYRIVFNNDATHDDSLIITIDGIKDTVSVADNEERSAFVVLRDGVANHTGVVDLLDVADSTSTMIDLNIPFQNQFLVEQNCEDGGLSSCTVIYGVFE